MVTGSRGHARVWLFVALCAMVAALASCACSPEENDPARRTSRRERERAAEREHEELGEKRMPGDTAGDDDDRSPDDPNKLVYLISLDRRLWSFNPKIPKMGAYRLVGNVECRTRSNPVSMAVDRHGWAWVFYASGELFRVSIKDASCQPTSYAHPSSSTRLGMGFTATAPGSKNELLYIINPEFGLATIGIPSLGVTKLNKLADRGAELTGGGDALLFQFEPNGLLSEIDMKSFTLKPMHSFQGMGWVSAWAFARYAGRFYLFTASGGLMTRTTEYDPKTNNERVRDPDIGFQVVGAGQSTLVPKPDLGAEISGDFPDDPPPAPSSSAAP